MNKYLTPKKYLKKAQYYWDKIYYGCRYNLENLRMIEKQKFNEMGFKYDDALEKLNNILCELGKPNFASQKGMGSIHWVLFCGVSHIESINNILEIGTYDGETALLLSKIFPNSTITTVDLPDSDPIFSKSYQRDDPDIRKSFKDRQKQNLLHPRITFLQVNSFFIPGILNQKFDLIWIDGGHLYPEIAWDICNAYHLCNQSGWLMCDDVIPEKNGFRDNYISPDSLNVLEYLSQRTGDRVTYFLKRESPEWSANPHKRKYVAVMRKS